MFYDDSPKGYEWVVILKDFFFPVYIILFSIFAGSVLSGMKLENFQEYISLIYLLGLIYLFISEVLSPVKKINWFRGRIKNKLVIVFWPTFFIKFWLLLGIFIVLIMSWALPK